MKKRIDLLLVEKELAQSRERAKAMVIAGGVHAGGVPVKSPSDQFDTETEITLLGEDCRYVSRGGLKLEKALDLFGVDLKGKVCADIGASTGGFTDCMLRRGASLVYAVDVGYGQFDWKLRNDPRVKLLERTNARYLQAFDLPAGFVCIDVSFISLSLIFPAALRISGEDAAVVALVKPQFEAGRSKVGKRGVVKDAAVHIEVLERIRAAAAENGLALDALTYSPIKGPHGNIEFLAKFQRNGTTRVDLPDIPEIVARAHGVL